MDDYLHGRGAASFARWDSVHTLGNLLAARFDPPLEPHGAATADAVTLSHRFFEDDDSAARTRITLTRDAMRLERTDTPARTHPFAPPRNEVEAERLASTLRGFITDYAMLV